MSISEKKNCLEDQLHDALAQSPYLTRKSVRCEASDGRIILKGQVGTYFQKQMAAEVLRHIDGVEQIENQLEVVWR
jgi:osmotically-inducible protein OsmY